MGSCGGTHTSLVWKVFGSGREKHGLPWVDVVRTTDGIERGIGQNIYGKDWNWRIYGYLVRVVAAPGEYVHV